MMLTTAAVEMVPERLRGRLTRLAVRTGHSVMCPVRVVVTQPRRE